MNETHAMAEEVRRVLALVALHRGWLRQAVALAAAFLSLSLLAGEEGAPSPFSHMTRTMIDSIPQYPPRNDGFFPSTSMIAVLADPARFDGKRIRLKAFGAIERAHDFSVVCLSRESLLHGIEGNMISLDLSRLEKAEQEEFYARANNKCCVLTGVVDTSRGGWVNMYPCTLIVTSYIIQVEPEDRQRSNKPVKPEEGGKPVPPDAGRKQ